MKPQRVQELLERLHGVKHLIAGNHDRCHAKIEQKKWIQPYIAAGFASVQTELALEITGKTVLLQHFPYRDLSEPKQRYHMSRPLDHGGWLIHGHVHDRWQVNNKQINVGVDVWNFEPVSLKNIETIIANGPVACDATEGSQSW
jgi:calcineurin-like phosphoesterase family protein